MIMHDGEEGNQLNTSSPTANNNHDHRLPQSPAIARRRKLTRTKSSPVLLLVSGRVGGSDLPPLVGAPCDPKKVSRYAHHHSQEKNVSGSVSPTKTLDSPVITRRGRQLKPHLVRQGSEPQLSHRLSELKLIPSPPEHGVQSPRSNGSSCCNSPRLIKRTYGRSADGLNSSGSSLRNLQNPNQSLPSPSAAPPRPHSPLISSDSPLSIFYTPSSAAAQSSNTPITTPRHGVRIRRSSGRDDTPDGPPSSPGLETQRYQFPVCLPGTDDQSTRSRCTWPPPRQTGIGDEADDNFICETTVQRAIDDETGEPILTRHSDYNISISDPRHTDEGVNNNGTTSHPSNHGHLIGQPGHSVFGPNQNPVTDMLYDITETHDEVVVQLQETIQNNRDNAANEPSESEEDVSDEEKLPEYQKPPLPTKNRINQWLEGLRPSTACIGDNGDTRTGGTVLPNI